MKLVTVAEMRVIEQETDARGQTYAQMMQAAGEGVAEVVTAQYSRLAEHTVLGLVGKGNNGGDTLVALAELQRRGWQVAAYLAQSRPNDPLVARVAQGGGWVLEASDDPNLETLARAVADNAVLLDGLLGTGIHLPLRPPAAEILRVAKEVVQAQRLNVVAVDVPSGIDCDTGAAAEETIPADITVTMAAAKVGMAKLPALALVGRVIGVDIGVPDDLPAWQAVQRYWVDPQMVLSVLPERPSAAHKGTFGTAMVVAGSINMSGTALLAAEAAYRVGAGKVTLATPSPLYAALAGQLPEATWLLLPHELGVIAEDAAPVLRNALTPRVKAMLLGPGWGQENTTAAFLKRLLGAGANDRPALGFVPASEKEGNAEKPALPPLVLDADGLKLLAQMPDWPQRLPPATVLTPHPAEMALLTGLSVEEVQADRLAVAGRFARQWGCVVALTGAGTVVAAPDGRTAVVPAVTAALARAGTGGVLAGMVAGLLAQGVPPWEAAWAAGWLHGQAGVFAWESVGSAASVLASDVCRTIPAVFQAIGY